MSRPFVCRFVPAIGCRLQDPPERLADRLVSVEPSTADLEMFLTKNQSFTLDLFWMFVYTHLVRQSWSSSSNVNGVKRTFFRVTFAPISNWITIIFMFFSCTVEIYDSLPNNWIRFECKRLSATLSFLTLARDSSTRPFIWSIPVTRPFSPI